MKNKVITKGIIAALLISPAAIYAYGKVDGVKSKSPATQATSQTQPKASSDTQSGTLQIIQTADFTKGYPSVNVLVFAKEDKQDFFGIKEKAYVTLNSYQDKFVIDKDNQVKRHVEKYVPKSSTGKNSLSSNDGNAVENNSDKARSLETTLQDMENQVLDSLKKQ